MIWPIACGGLAFLLVDSWWYIRHLVRKHHIANETVIVQNHKLEHELDIMRQRWMASQTTIGTQARELRERDDYLRALQRDAATAQRFLDKSSNPS